MKRLIALELFLLFFSLNSFAYRSIFGSNSTQWIIRFESMVFTVENDTFFVSKDTIVYGLLYKKVSSKHSNGYCGLLREDTINGKVWYKSIGYDSVHFNDTLEKLAFDFSLQQDDTFDVSNVNYGCGSVFPLGDSLKKVDTVYYVNGVKHIQFVSLSDPGGFYEEPLVLIEGIGSNWGVLWKEFHSFMNSSHYLICSYKNGDKTFYENKKYQGKCDNGTNILRINNPNDKILFYPQPATAYLYLKNNSNSRIHSVVIIDLLGAEHAIDINKAGKEKDISIDLSNFPSGIYILKMQMDNMFLITQKINIIH